MGFMLPPSRWEEQHSGFVARSTTYQAANGGELPQTPIWRLLERRFDANESRFSYWHPNIAAMIRESREADVPYVPVAPSHPWMPPTWPVVPVVPAIPALPPASVPAPGSLSLGLVAVAAFVARRLLNM